AGIWIDGEGLVQLLDRLLELVLKRQLLSKPHVRAPVGGGCVDDLPVERFAFETAGDCAPVGAVTVARALVFACSRSATPRGPVVAMPRYAYASAKSG